HPDDAARSGRRHGDRHQAAAGRTAAGDLLAVLGAKDIAAAGSVRVFLGGPVQPEIGFVVHSSGYHRPDTIAVDGRIAVTSSREILRDIADKAGPMKSL